MKTASRSLEVDVEKCVAQVGSRFDMIVLAAARSREIRQLNKNSEQYEHQHTSITALLEIQEGKIDIENLVKKVK
jgi:DNA-directed RNA polymerase omega subunit